MVCNEVEPNRMKVLLGSVAVPPSLLTRQAEGTLERLILADDRLEANYALL